MSYKKRLSRLRKAFLPRAEAFLITCPENRRFLSGFPSEDVSLQESAGALLLTRKEAFILTDPRYQEEAKECSPLFEPRIYRHGLEAELEGLLSLLKVRSLLLEPHCLSWAFFNRLQKRLSAVELKEAPPLVERIREIKDAEELEAIRKSLRIAEEILESIVPRIRPGITEKALAAQIIEMAYRRAEGPSFPPIVASGPNAAKPHAEPSEKELRLGEPLIIDMGVKWCGYCSDITRTFCVGKPEQRFKEVYSLVLKAKEEAEKVLAPGELAKRPDLVAREVFRRAGVERNYWHSLGHGVGLAIHEPPSLSFRSRKKLKAGQVVTVEPGLYFPDWGGVRLEDMVFLKEGGFERLNRLGFWYL